MHLFVQISSTCPDDGHQRLRNLASYYVINIPLCWRHFMHYLWLYTLKRMSSTTSPIQAYVRLVFCYLEVGTLYFCIHFICVRMFPTGHHNLVSLITSSEKHRSRSFTSPSSCFCFFTGSKYSYLMHRQSIPNFTLAERTSVLRWLRVRFARLSYS